VGLICSFWKDLVTESSGDTVAALPEYNPAQLLKEKSKKMVEI